MYCHFYHLFEWGDRLPKQLFVVSYQNGYCSATKWLNYTFPVWKCDKHLSICIPNMIDWCQGEWIMKKKQKTTFQSSCLDDQTLPLFCPMNLSFLFAKTRQVIMQRSAGTPLEVIARFIFLRSQRSALVFPTRPETMAAAVWCAAGCLGQGMAPSVEEDPDQLIMNSQSPCRKGALAYRVALSHLLWLVVQKKGKACRLETKALPLTTTVLD